MHLCRLMVPIRVFGSPTSSGTLVHEVLLAYLSLKADFEVF